MNTAFIIIIVLAALLVIFWLPAAFRIARNFFHDDKTHGDDQDLRIVPDPDDESRQENKQSTKQYQNNEEETL